MILLVVPISLIMQVVEVLGVPVKMEQLPEVEMGELGFNPILLEQQHIIAGGGGGGSHNPSPSSGGGAGGLGGGGAAGTFGTNSPGTSGSPNTGGGGGGASTSSGGNSNGGDGGSGIVVLRYLGTPLTTGGTITQNGGYTIHTFTNLGTNSFATLETTTISMEMVLSTVKI